MRKLYAPQRRNNAARARHGLQTALNVRTNSLAGFVRMSAGGLLSFPLFVYAKPEPSAQIDLGALVPIRRTPWTG